MKSDPMESRQLLNASDFSSKRAVQLGGRVAISAGLGFHSAVAGRDITSPASPSINLVSVFIARPFSIISIPSCRPYLPNGQPVKQGVQSAPLQPEHLRVTGVQVAHMKWQCSEPRGLESPSQHLVLISPHAVAHA